MALLEKGSDYDDSNNPFSITSVGLYISKISQLAASERFYFRGDGDGLVPHIGKKWAYGNSGLKSLSIDQERYLLHRFQRFANPGLNSDTALWEVLFLARHYGLPTRLLDWSTNPLVALYFALGLRADNKEESQSSGSQSKNFLWAITLHPNDRRSDIDILAPRSDPLKQDAIPLIRADGSRECMQSGHDAVKIVFPIHNSTRITAQRGVFTWQSDPRRSIESYIGTTLPDQNLDIAKLYRWSVPSDLKKRSDLMIELNSIGIDARAISPDLDGVCNGLLHRELLFS